MGDHFWLSCGLTHSTLQSYAKNFQISANESLVQLARAISANTYWDTLKDSVLVYRRNDNDAVNLAVCTPAPPHQSSSIQTQLNYLNQSIEQIRYFNPESCIEHTHELAIKIKSSIDEKTLATAQVISIPRGGMFVNALLSYLLPLQHHQLDGTANADSPLILIDDCSISGYRLYNQLKNLKHREIYFFTLASPKELRDAALSKEPRLVLFESVFDIPVVHHNQLQNTLTDRYWLGQAQAICFPWGETQRFYTSANDKALNCLWSISPLESNLKSRLRKPLIDVFEVKESDDCAISTQPHILYYSSNGLSRIYNTVSREQYSLEKSASEIWQSLLKSKSISDSLDYLKNRFNVQENNLKEDILTFISKLKQLEIIH